ncbi:MAG: single-stranded-DNA-specific exonuclease RecJ [Bdellovibrionales bacterium GWB1_52_6]|nr:MAG: single-stranded-DNA-specific exonuclease RecJ [Bdellovibrionales bacterium GWB1_52_6]OFZ04174.1 MAG: single-stranded-DNA-specific exonuclease RecJ [Bdellovibrionales bacterium GWA1_52_35]HCM40518.1 single-stranded-DNA-specific exonuclease RecJ [Bdellovibrionales bacterium]
MQPREWKPRLNLEVSGASESTISELSRETGLSPVTVRVCLMRGLNSAVLIERFLNPRLDGLTPVGSIKDMDLALARLSKARAAGELIRVHGDYDVDGTSGAALLAWILRDFGFRFDVRQPDRFRDGYGLNVRAVDEAKEAGVQVLLTVDCGITSFDAARRAAELGIDLLIVDHHQLDPARGLPQAVAIINPQRSDCTSGLKQLCGCGLAFFLAVALRSRGREEGWFQGCQEPNLKQHLDLVVMATSADMVSLTGDNHILARQGLEVLKSSAKPGIQALLKVAGVDLSTISPGDLGFVIAPRINASGRMRSASLAFELLTTEDPVRAMELAQTLEKVNAERATLQNQIWDEVRQRVEQGIADGRFQHGIVVADERWHEGVVGIVASRVTETFRRPAAVIAIRDGIGKGSVRSFAGKDVLSALRASASHLAGFGGHKHAAGLSLLPANVDLFAREFDAALSTLEEDAASKPLLIEGECSLHELNLDTLRELERMGPFGPGNPEPVFVFRASIKTQQILKGRHLKFVLDSVPSADSVLPGAAMSFEAIWFHAVERPDCPVLGEVRDWAGVPEINRFRGRVTPTIRVRDSRLISE